jgi:uncharacterized Fe-S cluster-containing protein
MATRTTPSVPDLPGLNCGLCGVRTCDELAARLVQRPELLERCIHLSETNVTPMPAGVSVAARAPRPDSPSPTACGTCAAPAVQGRSVPVSQGGAWRDTLGREFDFYLEHFPEEPGPREIILPHNPMITREMGVSVGDILIGRPLGMSCGCPITHCGVVTEVDARTGVIVWCVTGPLNPRAQGYKDIGYYIAEGYEGLITEARTEPRIGMRYYFQPRMCMLQWRHSGLVNYLNRTGHGWQVRLEGLWIG